VRKAKICDAKLLFIITAFNKLLSDDYFATLLRAESLSSLPKSLWIRMNGRRNDAA
jgi:ParB family chromosome partitioning protein